MSTKKLNTKSRVTRKVPVVSQIATHLLKDIQQGVWPVGARLDTMRDLADRFETSVRSIHAALSELERKGYVVCRQGAGTYVARTAPEFTLADTAVLCLEAKGHIFGDLTALLCQGLHELNMLPITADLSRGSPNHLQEIMRRAASGAAPFFIMHLTRHFPAQALLTPPFAHKTLIGILEWSTQVQIEQAHRVLVDHAAGGRLMADHLAEQGHRHVLILGPDNMIAELDRLDSFTCRHAWGFAQQWRKDDRRLSALTVTLSPNGEHTIDPRQLMALLNSSDPPTAVFGLMDASTRACQHALLEHAPNRLKSLAWAGYANTPWCRDTPIPFTSVDWRIDEVVRETLSIIARIRSGEHVQPKCIQITPRLAHPC